MRGGEGVRGLGDIRSCVGVVRGLGGKNLFIHMITVKSFNNYLTVGTVRTSMSTASVLCCTS